MKIRQLQVQGADFSQIAQARRQLLALPSDPALAREIWLQAHKENLERASSLGGIPEHAWAFRGDPDGSMREQAEFDASRLNFLALVSCLMLGTAGLPHLLTRYYTTPSEAEARTSVAWSLFFIALLYISAPALAVLVKFEVMNNLVGSSVEELPHWMAQWSRVDSGLLEISDINGDRVLQWGEIRLGADLIMLAMPELGGMPFVISGLVAAGGLAAALSTADGLLLTISNALVHALRIGRRLGGSHAEGRVILSKFALLAVAMIAAFVAAFKPAEILALVSASFSLAASAFFPAMVLGLHMDKVHRHAAISGMVCGLGVTSFYMLVNIPALRVWMGWASESGLWWGIQPASAGVFGVLAGFVVILLATRLMPAPADSGRPGQVTQGSGKDQAII